MPHPLVSVNLCVYNCGPYLQETLDSIFAQDYPNFELIMVDDGSTDNSFEIMKAAIIGRSNVVLLQNPGNLGLTPSRNRCVSHSKGKYIAIHDGDDISRSDRLSKQVAFFEQDTGEEYVLCGAWAKFFGEGLPTELYMNPIEYVREFMIENCSFVMTSLMIRRSFMDEHTIRFDETISIGEDYDFEFRMLNVEGYIRKGHNFPEPLISYRLRNDSMSKGENHEKTIVFSRNMRNRHFELLYGAPLSIMQTEMIEEIFIEKRYHVPPTVNDLIRFEIFTNNCSAVNKSRAYFDQTGLDRFFSVLLVRLFFSQQKITITSIIWLLKAKIVLPYVKQFSVKDFLFMVKKRFKKNDTLKLSSSPC